MGTWRFCCS